MGLISVIADYNELIRDYLPLIISNILVLVFFLFFQSNKEKTNAAYKSHIAELEARSLRAQMNPHFIYNALNSVQSVMILKGERESNRYIGMLSKLLRFTLEMSTKETISLEEEIDYLDAYLGLQKMRLSNKMNYNIAIDLNQKLKEYKLPPMLLQPIVENSILHGISPLSKREGLVNVHVTEKDDYLKVTIKDNGIGIKASQKNQKNKDKLHKSHATQILRERIDIFNYLKSKQMKFSLTDLNEKGNTGTQAIIEIPKI